MRPRFDCGDRVLVLELGKSGHIRTPFYIRGRVGTIIHRCGAFLNPEDLSIGIVSGPVVPLYRVGFLLRDLWTNYRGNSSDMLCIEIYDHWLAMAEAPGRKYFDIDDSQMRGETLIATGTNRGVS